MSGQIQREHIVTNPKRGELERPIRAAGAKPMQKKDSPPGRLRARIPFISKGNFGMKSIRETGSLLDSHVEG